MKDFNDVHVGIIKICNELFYKKYILKSAVNNPNRIPKLIFVHPDMNISLVICLHSVLSIQHGYNVQIGCEQQSLQNTSIQHVF